MPTYDFINTETQEVFERFMSSDERKEFLAANPHIKQTFLAAPAIGDSVRLGRQKTDQNFRDMLKHISKRAGPGSTIKYD